MIRGTLIVILGVLVLSCGGAPRAPKLAQFATQADSLRRDADRLVDRGALEAAKQALLKALALDAPDDPRALALRQDLHFALGSVYLRMGEPRKALEYADRGLALSDHNTVFRGNLLALRGLARESAGEALGALDDFAQALDLHKQLFDRALAAHGTAPTTRTSGESP